MRTSSLVAASLMLGLVAAGPARADYPDGATVTIINPWPAGGASDTISRLVAAELERRLGGTFIVENRPGASSGLGTTTVAQAAPDGLTLLSTTGTSVVINPLVMQDLPYRAEDIRAVARIAVGTYGLMAGKGFEGKTVEALIAAAEANPGGVTYGTNGPGTFTALLGDLIESELGVDMLPVPFQGAAPATIGLIGGVIDTNIEGITNGIENVEAGEYSVIAVTSPERHPRLPDVPTFAELGYDVVGLSNHGFYAPAGTPDEVVDALSAAIGEIMQDPAFAERIAALGQEPSYLSAEDFETFITEDRARWNSVVEASAQD